MHKKIKEPKAMSENRLVGGEWRKR